MAVDTITLAKRVEKLLGGINFIGNLNSGQQRLIYWNIVNAECLLLKINSEEKGEKRDKVRNIFKKIYKIDKKNSKIEKQALLNEAYSDLIDLFFINE